MAETWVINENFNFADLGSFNVNFISNGVEYERFSLYDYGTPRDPYYKLDYTYFPSSSTYHTDTAWEDFFSPSWTNQAYRTVTFDQPLDLTTPIGQWFSTNAEKQIAKLEVDLTTLSGWEGLASGDHAVTITAKAAGYRDSEPSESVTVTKVPTSYSITPTLTNVTAKADNPQTILSESSVTLTYYSDDGFNLPADVTVTGATKNGWTVTNEYAISGTGTNCLINGQSSASGYAGTDETLVFNLSADGVTYKLPATLSIPNATYTRTSDTAGTLSFSGVSADQSFTVVAEVIQTGYTVNVLVDGDNPGFLTWGTHVYDGTNTSGIYLGTLDSISGQSFVVTSGNIYFYNEYMSDDRFNGGTGTAGITVVDWRPWGPGYLLASVSANGTLTIHEYQN